MRINSEERSIDIPLLDKSTDAPVDEKNEKAMFDPKNSPSSTRRMVTCFARIAVPAVVTNVFCYGSAIINQVFAGHMNDPTKLAAIGLSNVCVSTMLLSLMFGLNCAQETLTSQAFGAGNLRLCGTYLNRGTVILVSFFIPFAILPCLFAEQIFLALGQDPEVSRLVHRQVYFLLPSVFCHGMYDLYKRWLACQRITFMPLVAMFAATIIHIPLCLLKDAVLLLSVMIYCCCSTEIKRALVMPNADTFRGWSEYLKISLPATIMLCSEWWAFQSLNVLAGILGVEEQAAMTIGTAMEGLMLMLTLGIQEATTGIIGNCIGANNVPLAKRFFSLITKICIATVIVLCTTVFLARVQIASFYTNSESVQELVVPIYTMISIGFQFDGLQCYLQGPIRAMGFQSTASWCAFGCYYIIGIPSSCLFAFKTDLGVLGLQGGITIAVFTQFLCYSIILCRRDWQSIADTAVERIKKEEAELLLNKSAVNGETLSNDDQFTKAV